MNWIRYTVKTYLLFIFILGAGFFVQTELQAQQISRLPCLSTWWSQDHSAEEVVNVMFSTDEAFLQLCDENWNTPLHVALKIEELSLIQMAAIAVCAHYVDKNDFQSYRNKQGESPLTLLEVRFGKVLARISNSSSIEELMSMFEERAFLGEIFLYITIQRGVMESSSEDTLGEFLRSVTSAALRGLDEDDQEDFLEELERQIGFIPRLELL